MQTTKRVSVLAAVLAAVVLVPIAGASPQSDANAVIKDYSRDAKITSCLFALGQLKNTLAQLGTDVDSYAAGVRSAVQREIKRIRKGRCKGKRPGGVNLRIVKIQSKGGARSESITVKNLGRKSVNLRGFVLRDSDDHALRINKTTLKSKRSLRIVTGCRKGTKKAVRRGSRYYACRTKQFWDDSGDIVELVNPKGGLISKKKY